MAGRVSPGEEDYRHDREIQSTASVPGRRHAPQLPDYQPAQTSMDFLSIAFNLASTALALYFANVRFRAGMPIFGHAMVATAILGLVFSLADLDLAASICGAGFIVLYMKSLAILHQHGLDDGSLS